MTARTALKKSIEHWIENVEVTHNTPTGKSLRNNGYRVSGRHCACCLKYVLSSAKSCYKCPIYQISLGMLCDVTPYINAAKHLSGSKKAINDATLEAWFLLNVWYCLGYKGDPV